MTQSEFNQMLKEAISQGVFDADSFQSQFTGEQLEAYLTKMVSFQESDVPAYVESAKASADSAEISKTEAKTAASSAESAKTAAESSAYAAAEAAARIEGHISNSGIHVADSDRRQWNNKAEKPVCRQVTLSVSGWDATTKKQIVVVEGVLANERRQLITVVPAISKQTQYYKAGVMCTGQGTNTLTFTAKTVPTTSLLIYVVIQEMAV